jgi:hypothetical protein
VDDQPKGQGRLVVFPRRGERGQHTAELAVCIGLVTAAVIGMQHYVRQALNAGLRGASDTMLGPPPALDPDKAVRTLDMAQTTQASETASGLSAIQTNSLEYATGRAENQDVRLRITPIPLVQGTTPVSGPVDPPADWDGRL